MTPRVVLLWCLEEHVEGEARPVPIISMGEKSTPGHWQPFPGRRRLSSLPTHIPPPPPPTAASYARATGFNMRMEIRSASSIMSPCTSPNHPLARALLPAFLCPLSMPLVNRAVSPEVSTVPASPVLAAAVSSATLCSSLQA